jgi:predicted branched-subunit amino acid permease
VTVAGIPYAFCRVDPVDGGIPTQLKPGEPAIASRLGAAWRGARDTPIVPALILFGTFVAFGALTKEGGLTWLDTVFMSVFIFALPAQVVLVDQMVRGASILTAALAVTATAVRLLPMCVALLPVIRDKRVPKWMEFTVAIFIAVTMWVEAMRRVPNVERHLRAAYVLGITAWLVAFSTFGGLLGFFLAARVPPIIAAALLFMTPIYFLLAMVSNVNSAAGITPIALGLMLGPWFHVVAPELDLFLTGLVGGTVSFVLSRTILRKGKDQ